MKKPILALVPSGYKASNLYTPIPINGDGDFVFTRATLATRINRDGLIEEVAANVPRLNYSNSSCPSVLLEEASTNLMTDSSDLSAWNDIAVTVDATSIIAPDGLLMGAKIGRTSTVGNYISDFFNKTASALTYTSSIFVKRGNTDELGLRSQGAYPARIDLRYNFETNEIYYTNPISGFVLIGTNVENYPNGWVRLSWTFTSDTNTLLTGISLSPRLTSGNTDSNDTSINAFCYVWGGQCEEKIIATSYIPTSGGSYTRNLETCNDAGDLALFEGMQNKGSMFVDFDTILDGRLDKSLALSDGTNNNRVMIRQKTSGDISSYILKSGVTQAFITAAINPTDKSFKVCFTWEQNDCKLYVNGVKTGEDLVVDLGSMQPLFDFSFDEGDGGISKSMTGEFKDVRLYNEVLTEAESIELTTI